jgi:hypothetical protein
MRAAAPARAAGGTLGRARLRRAGAARELCGEGFGPNRAEGDGEQSSWEEARRIRRPAGPPRSRGTRSRAARRPRPSGTALERIRNPREHRAHVTVNSRACVTDSGDVPGPEVERGPGHPPGSTWCTPPALRERAGYWRHDATKGMTGAEQRQEGRGRREALRHRLEGKALKGRTP